MVGPPAAAAPFLDRLPAATTPAAETATDARESGPAIRSPSATRGGLNLRKILRRGGDVVGPARGLRVVCRVSVSREQNGDRKTERRCAHPFSPSSVAMPPNAPQARSILLSQPFWSTSTIAVCATALLAMSVALMASGGADTD